MLPLDTTQGEVSESKLHCGVRLQTHVLTQSIQVQPCDAAVFVGFSRLALYDGG